MRSSASLSARCNVGICTPERASSARRAVWRREQRAQHMRRFDIGMIAADLNALRIGKRVLELGGYDIDSHSDVFLSDNEVLIQLRAKPGFSTEQECCTATLAALRLLAVLAVLAAKARLASAAVQHSCRGSLLFGHTLFSEDLNDLPRVPVATFRLF